MGSRSGNEAPRREIAGFYSSLNGHRMANEWSIGTIWSEEAESGLVLHIRVGTGADVMLTLPNAEVAAQAEARYVRLIEV